MLPPAPEIPLQMIKCGCSKSVCETSRCKYKVNHLYCTDLCCCGAEEDSCKILPVINMLMTLNSYFHVDSDISLAVSTRMPHCPGLTFEDDSTYKHAKDKSDCNCVLLSVLSKYNG